jgi:hypothetical protein
MRMQQKRSSDTSVIGTVIAAICIIIYVVALVQAAVRLYLSVDQRKIASDLEFNLVAGVALSAAGQSSFMDEAYISSMNKALSSCKTIEGVIISGPDAEYAFERKRGHAITWINNSPRIIKKFGFTNEGLYRNLPVPNLRNVNIQAVAGIFDYVIISRILKETLLIILIGFTLAFFTMLLQLLLGKPQESPVTAKEDVEIEFDDVPDSSQIAAQKKTPSAAEKPFNLDEELPPLGDSKISAVSAASSAQAAETGPKGLYSPRSNIGWEEYTDDRLESELHRCASTEKDLTLLFIEFKDKLNDEQYKQAAEEVVSFFASRDLLFERGSQGITAILPGVDFEAGMDKAQKFHQRIIEKLFFNHRADDCVYIGLSSRAGRLLNAERLLLETGEALNRASKESDTSIVAFKSDLEKYRKFIASQSPSHS